MLNPDYKTLLNLTPTEATYAGFFENGWWSTTEGTPNPYSLYFSTNTLVLSKDYKRTTGLFVRCIKN